MGFLRGPLDIGKITDLDKYIRMSSQLFESMLQVINGTIDFDTNINCQTITVNFGAANSDTVVSHKLNKTNVNFEIVNKAVSLDVYHGSNIDTNSSICLRCTVANAIVKVRLS